MVVVLVMLVLVVLRRSAMRHVSMVRLRQEDETGRGNKTENEARGGHHPRSQTRRCGRDQPIRPPTDHPRKSGR
ncbi:hypothetical protein R3P38DRAFT_2883079 [Favolaschia claudopus]|uniref:Secreted protein n=1 Tax=Favolaschia claudopus TaxID=2862362 RepID=A0AAW0CZB9_9AGAR